MIDYIEHTRDALIRSAIVNDFIDNAVAERTDELRQDRDRFSDRIDDMAAEIAALRAEVARLTAERDAALAGAVTVKPLVWEYHPAGCLGSAGGIGASYIVDTRSKDGSVYFVKGIHPSPQFHTLDAAKAAAQADYDARIRAALIPAPDTLRQVREALRLAADRMAWLTVQFDTGTRNFITAGEWTDEARAAIALLPKE